MNCIQGKTASMENRLIPLSRENDETVVKIADNVDGGSLAQ
jgi:hypothetical protein